MSIWSVTPKGRRVRGLILSQKGWRRTVGQAEKRAAWKGAGARMTAGSLYRELARSLERDGNRRAWRELLPHPNYGEVRHGRGS